MTECDLSSNTTGAVTFELAWARVQEDTQNWEGPDNDSVQDTASVGYTPMLDMTIMGYIAM